MQRLNFAARLIRGGTGVVATGAPSVLALAMSFERLANFRTIKVAPQALADKAFGLCQLEGLTIIAMRARRQSMNTDATFRLDGSSMRRRDFYLTRERP